MNGRRHGVFRTILVGYDGSAQSEKAADMAFAIAEPATSVEVHAVLDDAKEHYQDGFARLAGKAREREVIIETEIVVGHPAEQIIHRAETAKVDLVILGRRGISMFEKWILGSVSERVLRYAHCPVMVIR
jgi:nucleotide-binding universal stress UspA family protein